MHHHHRLLAHVAAMPSERGSVGGVQLAYQDRAVREGCPPAFERATSSSIVLWTHTPIEPLDGVGSHDTIEIVLDDGFQAGGGEPRGQHLAEVDLDAAAMTVTIVRRKHVLQTHEQRMVAQKHTRVQMELGRKIHRR